MLPGVASMTPAAGKADSHVLDAHLAVQGTIRYVCVDTVDSYGEGMMNTKFKLITVTSESVHDIIESHHVTQSTIRYRHGQREPVTTSLSIHFPIIQEHIYI